MLATVTETGLRHRALIDETVPCCEAGHPDAAEAAKHAWTLTTALARKQATGGTCPPAG